MKGSQIGGDEGPRGDGRGVGGAVKLDDVLDPFEDRLDEFRGRSGEGSVRESWKQGDHHIAQQYDQAWYSDNEPELLVNVSQPQPEACEEQEERNVEERWDRGHNEVHFPAFHGLKLSLPLLCHILVVFCLNIVWKESAPLQTEDGPGGGGEARHDAQEPEGAHRQKG